jgi:Leucine-rich repeat (LRR) protein
LIVNSLGSGSFYPVFITFLFNNLFMSDLDYKAILTLLKSDDDVNHELAFQMLEGIGIVGNSELAGLLTCRPEYLLRCFKNNWKIILSLVYEINFRYHPIPQLPHDVDLLENLKVLSLSHCNLVSLPVSIGKLQNLKHLVLNYNSLSSLPSEVGELIGLVELSLVGNKFNELPSSVLNLHNLEILSLIDNNLQDLPKGLSHLSQLRKVILRNNKLTELPMELCMLENLEILDLADNDIVRLPNALCCLKNLKSLYLDRNKLSKSEKQKVGYILPDTIIHF